MANNAAARNRLAELSRKLRAFPLEAATRAAQHGAKVLDGLLRNNISAGLGPDGTPWPPRQDGGAALQQAGEGLTVRPVDTVILASLGPPWSLHHWGRARGHVVRQILPTKKAPQPMVDAVEDSLRQDFREAVT